MVFSDARAIIKRHAVRKVKGMDAIEKEAVALIRKYAGTGKSLRQIAAYTKITSQEVKRLVVKHRIEVTGRKAFGICVTAENIRNRPPATLRKFSWETT